MTNFKKGSGGRERKITCQVGEPCGKRKGKCNLPLTLIFSDFKIGELYLAKINILSEAKRVIDKCKKLFCRFSTKRVFLSKLKISLCRKKTMNKLMICESVIFYYKKAKYSFIEFPTIN